jgi:aspartate aminotransferase
MTGFRIGYGVSTNKEIIDKMTKIQAAILTSVAEPMQYAALAAIGDFADLNNKHNNQKDTRSPSQNSNIMKNRLTNICNQLVKLPLNFIVPDGSMYVYPELPHTIQDDDIMFVSRLLDLGLAIAPGRAFGSSYRRFIRLSACQPTHILEEGLKILEQALYSR